jgi:hypothetical protein
LINKQKLYIKKSSWAEDFLVYSFQHFHNQERMASMTGHTAATITVTTMATPENCSLRCIVTTSAILEYGLFAALVLSVSSDKKTFELFPLDAPHLPQKIFISDGQLAMCEMYTDRTEALERLRTVRSGRCPMPF